MNKNLIPSPSDLITAPRLERWKTISHSKTTRLQGEVTGHPTLHDQRIITSPLLAVNEAEKWARTSSRFYALGEPAFRQPTELEVARYKKRLSELSKRELYHQLYELSDYPTIARVVARRSTTTKLDGRSILAMMEAAHPIDLTSMTEAECELIDQLRVRRDGLAF